MKKWFSAKLVESAGLCGADILVCLRIQRLQWQTGMWNRLVFVGQTFLSACVFSGFSGRQECLPHKNGAAPKKSKPSLAKSPRRQESPRIHGYLSCCLASWRLCERFFHKLSGPVFVGCSKSQQISARESWVVGQFAVLWCGRLACIGAGETPAPQTDPLPNLGSGGRCPTCISHQRRTGFLTRLAMAG